MKNNDKIKQSILLGSLTSTFGIFVTKILGLLYTTPLKDYAGSLNLSFYNHAYTYYDYLLKICSGGIPFAIASLVAIYVAKKDYASAKYVKKIGMSITLGLTMLSVIVFFFLVGPLSRQVLGAKASAEDITKMMNVFYILIACVAVVPFLSAIRGYYQGLKRLDIYSSSNILEQFVRVTIIIVDGFILVKLLNFDSVYAIYTAIAAACIAAIIALIYIKVSTKKDDREFEECLALQENIDVKKKEIVIQMLQAGIPYLLVNLIGQLNPIINSFFYTDYVTSIGETYEYGAITLVIFSCCGKITAIPQVLSQGFSAGLIPYMSEVLDDKEKVNEYINKILNSVLYLLIPIVIFLVFFAKDAYYILFGTEEVGMNVVQSVMIWVSILGFFYTVAPTMSAIMVTVKQRKISIIILTISVIIKYITFFPCVRLWKVLGIPISSIIASLFVVVSYLIVLKNKFNLKLKNTLIRSLKVLIISIISVLPSFIIMLAIGFNYIGGTTSRILDLAISGVLGVLFLIIYYFITYKTSIIKECLEIDGGIKSLIKKFKV